MKHEQEIREAQELFGVQKKVSFAKKLTFGQLDLLLAAPYPSLDAVEELKLQDYLDQVRDFLTKNVDPVSIDRNSHIPEKVIQGLFQLGVMSMSIPKEYGGFGFSQYAYCRVLEEVGAHDASVAILINAHQSIGLKSLLLFGNKAQQSEWFPKLVRGDCLAAFALTEPNAGSDAAGLETRAVLNAEGTHYIINGKKQWITNGGVAGLITVLAKVPNDSGETGRERITAFLVTPDMPGFRVEEKALDKCGIRGTVTSKLSFENLKVPIQNVIGEPKKGLRIALTLLDFGRTTFGASCTGVAKRCLNDAIQHSKNRIQFGKPLCHFELVKKKLAEMAALSYAMESGTYLTAALIDRGAEEYMVETAMLKIFTTEKLWHVVNETIQIFGGRAYFTDLPYERMMRDARINMIGEGANDVLRGFVALVGIKDLALEVTAIRGAGVSPFQKLKRMLSFAQEYLFHFQKTDYSVHPLLDQNFRTIQRLTRKLGKAVIREMARHQEELLEKQYIQGRIADIATELYFMSAVFLRLDLSLIDDPTLEESEDFKSGKYYLALAEKSILQQLRTFHENSDDQTTDLARSILGSIPAPS
jgi:acyl-CoA dehydrogenase family member 9